MRAFDLDFGESAFLITAGNHQTPARLLAEVAFIAEKSASLAVVSAASIRLARIRGVPRAGDFDISMPHTGAIDDGGVSPGLKRKCAWRRLSRPNIQGKPSWQKLMIFTTWHCRQAIMSAISASIAAIHR